MIDSQDAMLNFDGEGYLSDYRAWTNAAAQTLASKEGIVLSGDHWSIIRTLRDFYARTDVSPAMRPLVKLVREQHGEVLGNSIALMTLFGENPAKTAAKVSGLPRPPNCL